MVVKQHLNNYKEFPTVAGKNEAVNRNSVGQ